MKIYRIAHLVDGRARVGSISSVKRIVKNYSYSDSHLLIVAFGKPLGKIDGVNEEDIYYVDLKGVTHFIRFFDNKKKFWLLFVSIGSFLCDFVRLYKFARRNNIDAIHTHLHLDAIFCLLTIFKINVFVNIRGIVNRDFLGGIGYYIYRHVVPMFATKVIGISKATIESIQIPKEKSVLIYNGLEGKISSPNSVLEDLYKKHFVVSSVIRFMKGKGIYFLSDIIIDYFKSYPTDNVHFVLVAPIMNESEIPCKESFFQKLKTNGLIDKISYFDYFPDYSYIMPYTSCLLHTTLKREGFGNVVLEANWFSKPVISTPCMGVNDIIENNKSGFILSDYDSNEAVKRIHQLYADKFLYDTFCMEAYEISHDSKFTIDENLQKLHDLYLTCLR